MTNRDYYGDSIEIVMEGNRYANVYSRENKEMLLLHCIVEDGALDGVED